VKKKFLPRNKKDYLEYASKLTPDERSFIEKVYEDLYAGGVYDEDTVLKSEESRAEARKNKNSSARDLYEVAERAGALADLDENTQAFMEDMSDDFAWRNVYDQTGFVDAAVCIFDQTVKEIENRTVNIRVILNRFLEKMTSLKRLSWRDRKRQK
jgi:hypothetical protein